MIDYDTMMSYSEIMTQELEHALAKSEQRVKTLEKSLEETRRQAFEEAAQKVDDLIRYTRELCDFTPTDASSDRLRFAILGRIDGLIGLASSIRILADIQRDPEDSI